MSDSVAVRLLDHVEAHWLQLTRSFGFAIYSAAHDRYQDAVLRTGLHTATPSPPTNLRGHALSHG